MNIENCRFCKGTGLIDTDNTGKPIKPVTCMVCHGVGELEVED